MSGRGRPARAAAGLLVGGTLLAACSGSPPAGDAAATLGQLVLDSGPSGYTRGVDRALSADEAAAATSSDPHALARALQQTGFEGGWSRIWTHGDAYLGIVAIAAASPFGAGELQQFQATQLAAGRGVYAYDDPDIPGARAFDFSATTRQGGRQVFCQAVLFSVEPDVFTLDDCSSAPRAADRVLATALAQYRRAAAAFSRPAAPPPSPS